MLHRLRLLVLAGCVWLLPACSEVEDPLPFFGALLELSAASSNLAADVAAEDGNAAACVAGDVVSELLGVAAPAVASGSCRYGPAVFTPGRCGTASPDVGAIPGTVDAVIEAGVHVAEQAVDTFGADLSPFESRCIGDALAYVRGAGAPILAYLRGETRLIAVPGVASTDTDAQ